MRFGLGYSIRLPRYRALMGRDFFARTIGMLALCVVSFASAKDWQASVGASSDYVYRGVSLTWERPAYQAGFQVRLPKRLQFGVWASTIETRDNVGTPLEATAFASGNWILSDDWHLRTGYVRHQYFGHRGIYSFDYDEFFASASFRSQLTLSVNLSPNAARYRYQESPERALVMAFEATWLQPLFFDMSASVGAGYNDLSSLYGTGYTYWHAGLLRDIGPLGLSVMFIDTDDHAATIYGDEITGKRWAATARWRF
jgi:uncharacterized protein (TIGR02001 family)